MKNRVAVNNVDIKMYEHNVVLKSLHDRKIVVTMNHDEFIRIIKSGICSCEGMVVNEIMFGDLFVHEWDIDYVTNDVVFYIKW